MNTTKDKLSALTLSVRWIIPLHHSIYLSACITGLFSRDNRVQIWHYRYQQYQHAHTYDNDNIENSDMVTLYTGREHRMLYDEKL